MTFFLPARRHAVVCLLAGVSACAGPETTEAPNAPATAQAIAADTLCACVLDHNMPLSAANADTVSGARGLYADLNAALAETLGREAKLYTDMSVYFKRPVRQGLLANNCDIQIGLPRQEGDWYIPRKVGLTEAFLTVGYAIVVPKGTVVNKFEDLAGMSIVTQTGAPPVEALTELPDASLSFYLYPEQALAALARGDAEAAFVWGPTAGYLNRYLYEERYNVIPTDYSWPVAIGVRAADDSLRARLNEILPEVDVEALVARYGLPTGEAIKARPARAEPAS